MRPENSNVGNPADILSYIDDYLEAANWPDTSNGSYNSYTLNASMGTYTSTGTGFTSASWAAGSVFRYAPFVFSGFSISPTTRTIQFEITPNKYDLYIHALFSAELYIAAATGMFLVYDILFEEKVSGGYRLLNNLDEDGKLFGYNHYGYYTIGTYKVYRCTPTRTYRVTPVYGVYAGTLPSQTLVPQNNFNFHVWAGG